MSRYAAALEHIELKGLKKHTASQPLRITQYMYWKYTLIRSTQHFAHCVHRGVARSSPMLGHTRFVRNSAQSAEAFRRSRTCSVSVRGERMKLRRSISRPFSARFAIDYDTISADNSHAYLHRWGTASSC